MSRGGGISIDFASDATKFLARAKDVEAELAKVAASLDDVAREAQESGDVSAESLEQIKAEQAIKEFRQLAKAAHDSGDDMATVWDAAAEEAEDSLRVLKEQGLEAFEALAERADQSGRAIAEELAAGTEKAATAVEGLEKSYEKGFGEIVTEANKTSDDVAKSTKKGMSDAARATEEFRDESRQNLAESVSSFRGDVEDIPQLLQDVLGGVSTNLGTIGGLAAAGVAAAIGVTIAKLTELADSINERKEEMGELAQEILAADGNLAEVDFAGTMREWAFEIQDARSWWEVWQSEAVTNLENISRAAEEAGVDMSTVWRAMADPTASQAADRLGELRREYEQLKTATEEAEKVAEQTYDYREVDALTQRRNATKDLVDALGEQVDQATSAYDASVLLRAAEEGVTEASIRQRDVIAAQNSAIEQKNTLREKEIGLAASAFTAEGDYSAAVDDATTRIAENGSTIDANTEAGRANREALVALAREGRAYAETIAETGADQEDVNAIMQRAREDFLRAADAADMEAEAADNLANQLGLIPGEVKTKVTAETDEAARRIAAISTQITSIPDGTVRIRTVYDNDTATTRVASLASGGTIKAASGIVTGEGSDIEDRVPALLSPGEGVLAKRAVDHLGGEAGIEALNNLQTPAGVSDRQQGSTVNLGGITINAPAGMDVDALAEAVMQRVTARIGGL